MTITMRRAAVACAVLGIVAGLLLGFGPPRFQATPSLRYIHKAGLPWAFWTVLFVAYGGFLIAAAVNRLPGKLGVLAIGWWFGAALYACFLLSLLNATKSTATNPPVLAATTGFVVLHVLFAVSTQRADVPPRS